ncbi:hypothetical protein VTK56DRAFT_3088 [Thermocarpiscus australiensis]
MCARHSRQLLCLGWTLLALPFWCAAQVALPETVEVDLIFPRNADTYAPSPGVPIVFAIQNSRLAASLYPSFGVTLSQVGANDSRVLLDEFQLDNGAGNFSSSDPYFLYWNTNVLNHTEGTWILHWDVMALNCSKNASQEAESHPGFHNFGQRLESYVTFTTKNGGEQPDLVAATADSTCADTEGLTFNVTEILPYVPSEYYLPVQGINNPLAHRNSCAILSPTTAPAPQPCRVKIDAAAASSIAANLSCRTWHGCPSVGTPQFRVDGAAWFIAALSLAYFLLEPGSG